MEQSRKHGTRTGGNLHGLGTQQLSGYPHFTPQVMKGATALANALHLMVPADRELVIVCIGTDRSTGDAYGPLVGTALKHEDCPVPVYGTIHEPVHALNLEATTDYIAIRHRGAYVIAVDATLDTFDNVGAIQIYSSPLRPGANAGKELAAVGDCSVLGVVNVDGFLAQTTLQFTRLALVMDMAESTAAGLLQFLRSRVGQASLTVIQ
ncbi:spore protease YyaC [Alicyclobacillus sp. ALC3]|uniref:spore protease YyaC n=1 Tax=Alicyclobacillus sp. ALC3 TaxID=2796143 RepID=UPI0023796C96|nr:spore protease YyaC [Alicyclobacillus sp. ALC3]WDL96902.1 spore protease YyaC [Alicyclobacillus sp. ALC3]